MEVIGDHHLLDSRHIEVFILKYQDPMYVNKEFL